MKALWSRVVAAWLAFNNRYEGATFSTSRSYLPAAVQSARFDAGVSQRTELVRKSRYFEKNSAIFNRLCDLFETYTVGSGVQITPASSDANWNKLAKIEFDAWAQRCDFCGQQNFAGLFSLAARTWFVDGECFLLKTRLDPTRPNSEPRLQLFEGHLVATPPSLSSLEGSAICDGIAIDPNGRPVAFYIASEDAKGQKIWGPPRAAEYVIHMGEPSRAGLLRPLPFVYPVINKLHDVDDLEILEMKAAKEAARHINFIKNQAGELSQNQIRAARYGNSVVSTPLANGATVDETRRKYYEEAVGGETIVGRNGDEMQRLSSERPNVVTTEYWKLLKSDVCAGIGIPYVLVYPESMQGTVYRGALDMADSFFAARFVTISSAAKEVWNFWSDWARYAVPTLRDPPADFKNCTVHQPRSVNVDIGRNSTAMLQELAAGAATYEEVYGPLGKDWKERFDRLREQQKYAETIGLKLTFPGQPLPPDPATVGKPQPANA